MESWGTLNGSMLDLKNFVQDEFDDKGLAEFRLELGDVSWELHCRKLKRYGVR
jgi:hypothetical protein